MNDKEKVKVVAMLDDKGNKIDMVNEKSKAKVLIIDNENGTFSYLTVGVDIGNDFVSIQ